MAQWEGWLESNSSIWNLQLDFSNFHYVWIVINRIIQRKDDYRLEKDTHSNGGFALTDKVILGKYRSAGKDLIKQVGK